MKIDVFTHILPLDYKEAVKKKAAKGSHLFTLWETLTTLYDVNMRLDIMDKYEIDMHGLSTASPGLETLFDRETANEMARIANDGMAELVSNHPNRFFGIATVSLLDPEAAAEEVTRSVNELGLKGVQIYADINGKAIDSDDLEIFYDTVEKLDVPIWIHPGGTINGGDYVGEDKSKYLLWQTYGWPYETTLAMARLVFSGIMERHPKLKVICHHAGGMVSFYSERNRLLYPKTERMTGKQVAPNVTRPYIDQFKRFYVDTAIQGNVGGMMCALEFFGADHMLFATDLPFDDELGAAYTRSTLEGMSRLPVDNKIKEDIFYKNAAKLCKLESVNLGLK